MVQVRPVMCNLIRTFAVRSSWRFTRRIKWPHKKLYHKFTIYLKTIQARRDVLLWSIWIYTFAYASFIGLFGVTYACLLRYLQNLNNNRISNETVCAVWASANEVTVLVVWLKEVFILNSKDPDEKPHDKTSKICVQRTKTEISLGVWCTTMSHLFMHKFLVECQVFNTRQFIQSLLFSKKRKISISLRSR